MIIVHAPLHNNHTKAVTMLTKPVCSQPIPSRHGDEWGVPGTPIIWRMWIPDSLTIHTQSLQYSVLPFFTFRFYFSVFHHWSWPYTQHYDWTVYSAFNLTVIRVAGRCGHRLVGEFTVPSPPCATHPAQYVLRPQIFGNWTCKSSLTDSRVSSVQNI